jgi:hypothetical protein
MTESKQAAAPSETVAFAPPKRWRKAADYLIPPIVVPAALSMIILIYILVRGPV